MALKKAWGNPTGNEVDGNPLPHSFLCPMVTKTNGEPLKEALYSDMAKDFVGEVICVDLGVI